MPLHGSHADTRIQEHKEDGRNPSAWHAGLLNQVFVFNVICSNFLSFGVGREGHLWKQEMGFTFQYLENCNLVVITHAIPQNLHSVSLWNCKPAYLIA